MTKLKRVLCVLLVVLAILLIADVAVLWPQGEMIYWNNLYKSLTAEQIEEVKIEYINRSGEAVLSQEEIETLVGLLNRIHLEDAESYAYRDMTVGLKTNVFEITLKNGKSFRVEPCGNMYLVMNSNRGYLEEYEVLDAIGTFHWNLDQKYRLGK